MLATGVNPVFRRRSKQHCKEVSSAGFILICCTSLPASVPPSLCARPGVSIQLLPPELLLPLLLPHQTFWHLGCSFQQNVFLILSNPQQQLSDLKMDFFFSNKEGKKIRFRQTLVHAKGGILEAMPSLSIAFQFTLQIMKGINW